MPISTISSLALLALLIGAALAMFLVDRALLGLEERGWIYYRKKRGSASSVGNALLEVQALFEPSTNAVIEQRHEQSDDTEQGDPPDAY